MATLSRLETKEHPAPSSKSPAGSISSPSSPSAGTPSAREGMPFKPPPTMHHGDWLQALTEDKRAQVNEIFQEQANILREKVAAASGEGPPPLDKLQTLMEENTQEVKNKLQSILNEEEYRSFLDSVPKPPPLRRP
jgi:hypothetical protein